MPRIVINIFRYGTDKYLQYVRNNFLDLMRGTIHRDACLCCSCLYHKSSLHVGRKGTLRRKSFFVFWLYNDVNRLWTKKYFKEFKSGIVPALDDGWDRVINIVYALRDTMPTIAQYDSRDIERIVRRYKKSFIVEKTLIREIENATYQINENLSRWIYKNASLARMFSFIEDIYKIIESEGTIVRSRIRRISRPLQRVRKDLFDQGIDFLIEEGRITSKTYGRQTFLSVRK